MNAWKSIFKVVYLQPTLEHLCKFTLMRGHKSIQCRGQGGHLPYDRKSSPPEIVTTPPELSLPQDASIGAPATGFGTHPTDFPAPGPDGAPIPTMSPPPRSEIPGSAYVSGSKESPGLTF